MNSVLLKNIFRFIFLIAIQGLALKRVNLGGDDYNFISVFLYPIFIMLLPLALPRGLLVLVGFLVGIVVDYFYNTWGINAATCVFTAFMRPVILNLIEPAGGFKDAVAPTKRKFGFLWFIRYAAIFMFVHCLFFFSVEEFTLYYWDKILLRTIPSFIFSFIIVMIYSFIFDSSE